MPDGKQKRGRDPRQQNALSDSERNKKSAPQQIRRGQTKRRAQAVLLQRASDENQETAVNNTNRGDRQYRRVDQQRVLTREKWHAQECEKRAQTHKQEQDTGTQEYARRGMAARR